MKFNPREMPIQAERELMNLKADKLAINSKLDLLALMTDTEFPEEEAADAQ